MTPGCQTYGFLYNTGEINAVTTVESCKEYLDSIGLSYEEAVVTNSSEVQQAAQSLVGKVDAFFIPNDSVIQSAMNLVSEVAREAEFPLTAVPIPLWNPEDLPPSPSAIPRLAPSLRIWRWNTSGGKADPRYPIGCRPGYRRSDQQDHCRNHWRRDPGGYRCLRHFSGRCPIAVFPE